MRRLSSYCGLMCTILAILAGIAAGQQNKNKPARKKTSADTTALRAQRALARRSAIAAEDAYGPGSGYGGFSSTGGGTNGTSSGSSAFGGSGFGGSPFGSNLGLSSRSGAGGSQGFGGSSGAGTSAATGTGAGTANAGSATQTPATGAGTTGGQGQTGNGSTIPYLNQQVLEFAVSNLGKQVGSGVCWELGADALAYANAQPPNGQVFGEQVPLTSMLPGDILEFDNARFVGANYWLSLGAPYHTAIVSQVDGNSIAMLNQNVNGIKLVQITIIHLADLRSGTIAVYRPTARQ